MYGARDDETNLDVTISNILEGLERGMRGDFVGLVDNFETESNIIHMWSSSQSRIRMKCIYLTVTLEHALVSYHKKEAVRFCDLCDNAVEYLKEIPLGLTPVSNGRVIMN
eukprot:5904327-Ditylum_brightwellii.AAC.1